MRNQVPAHRGGKPGRDNLDELDHETRENGGIAGHVGYPSKPNASQTGDIGQIEFRKMTIWRKWKGGSGRSFHALPPLLLDLARC
jgi:hypothetical protein